MKKSILALVVSATLLSPFAAAHKANDVIVRVGGAIIDTNTSSKTLTKHANIDLDVRNKAQVAFTTTYMVSDNVGIELLGAAPFSHKIDASIPELNTAIPNAVKVKHLPPSLYTQYYFLNKNSSARPYLGVGVNYTRFFGAKSYHPQLISNLKVKKHSFGPVINAGVDIKLTDRLSLNTAMWYTRIQTKATFDALGKNHAVKIKLDPIVYFAGLSFKF